ncbi:hypothetical protein GYMLUDRAFT_70730 [Collybiopsis luxurians FD-317 M1]|nr:hypothetical protein GYMLUDRAFT_70730 [Collybiopsis luxurians FD-317 M1]
MPITNPNQLVEEFKKSGEFDRLRRELFAEFQKGDHIPAFNKKTEDVVKQRFASAKARSFLSTRLSQSESNLRTELMQEIQRYPYVETTVNDWQFFFDRGFNDDLKNSISRILEEERNPKENGDEKGVDPSQEKQGDSEEGQTSPSDSKPPISESKQTDIEDEEHTKAEDSSADKPQSPETPPSSVPPNDTTEPPSASDVVLTPFSSSKKDPSSSTSPQTRQSSSKLSSLSPLDTPSSLSPPLVEPTVKMSITARMPDYAPLPGPGAPSTASGTRNDDGSESRGGSADGGSQLTTDERNLDVEMADT